MDTKGFAGAILILSTTVLPVLAAPGLESMARELGSAARSAGLRRVSVAKFDAAGGASESEGLRLTEKLTTALVRTGRVQAVERTLLPKLMAERSLERTGAMGAGGPSETSLARVDGVVAGTYRVAAGRVYVTARVVDYRSGVIVAAAETEVESDEAGSFDPFDVPVPVLRGAFDVSFDAPRDAVAQPQPDCQDAARRVNALEESILDLKARYWAGRLREGLSGAAVKVNPGSTIPDPDLKARFYDTLKFWHAADKVRPLTPDEVSRFVRVDGEAYALFRDCGL